MIEVDATFDYSKKWEDRSRLEALRAQKGECDDVLIVQNGFVTDTSFCNILFKDSVAGCWVTSSTYLLQGTCRERLLDSGIVTVRDITISELYCYSHFMLINSMLDFDTRRAVEINTIHEIL